MKKNLNYKSADELAVYCSSLALILHSGMTLADGLSLLGEQAEDECSKGIAQSVAKGSKLSDALVTGGLYPSYMINMIGLGEKSGKLEDVVRALALYYEREQSVRTQLKSTLLYPLLLIGIIFAVVLILLFKVLPVFAKVYAELGGASTAVFLRVSNIICIAALVFIVLLGIFVSVLYRFTRSSKGYDKLMGLLGYLPVTRNLPSMIAAGRFSFALSLLISSGVYLDVSLALMDGIMDNLMRKKVEQCRASMKSGVGFADSVVSAGLMNGLQARMLFLGEKAGALDEVCEKIAALCDEDIEKRLSSALGVIEPALVILLCAIIGAMLVSIMLPLSGIMSAIG